MIGAMIASQFQGAQNWPVGQRDGRADDPGHRRSRSAPARSCSRSSGSLTRIRRRGSTAFAATSPRAADALRRWVTRPTTTPRPRSRAVRCSGCGLVLVLVFMFIPIVLVFVYSFNSGSSLVIWRGFSTQWWGSLFQSVRSPSTAAHVRRSSWRSASSCRRWCGWSPSSGIRCSETWTGPAFFVVAVVYTGETTNWYRDVFNDANVGDAMRNSFLAASGCHRHRGRHRRLRRHGARPPTGQVDRRLHVDGVPDPRDAGDHGRHLARHLVPAVHVVAVHEDVRSVPVRHQPPVGRSIAVRVGRGHADRARPPRRASTSRSRRPPATSARPQGVRSVRSRCRSSPPRCSPARCCRSRSCIDNTVISALIADAGSSTFPVALLSSLKSTIKPFWGVGAMVLFWSRCPRSRTWRT